MTNLLLRIKIEQRLNKLSSFDYDNIEAWMVIEAYNKAQVEWVRRNLHGNNMYKEGDEQSVRRIDDLQVLLTPHQFNLTDRDVYTETSTLPSNYLQFKRLTVYAKTECCDKRRMKVHLVEEASVDFLLDNTNSKPSFAWAETFITMSGNKINIYHNNDFTVASANLIYYREPRRIEMQGVVNPSTGIPSPTEVEAELKDDLIEVIVDDAASILAADIESMNQYQREQNAAERNN